MFLDFNHQKFFASSTKYFQLCVFLFGGTLNLFSSCISFLLVPNSDIACTMCIFIASMVCFHCVFRNFVHQLFSFYSVSSSFQSPKNFANSTIFSEFCACFFHYFVTGTLSFFCFISLLLEPNSDTGIDIQCFLNFCSPAFFI